LLPNKIHKNTRFSIAGDGYVFSHVIQYIPSCRSCWFNR